MSLSRFGENAPVHSQYKVTVNLTSSLPGSTKLNSHYSMPTERCAWTHACLGVFKGQPLTISVRAADGTLAALGVFTDKGYLRHVSQPGIAELHEPSDLVYSDEVALDALIHALADRRVPVCLRRVPAESPTVEGFREAARGKAWLWINSQGSCPYIPLPEAWKEPEAQLSSKLRSDLRRARRKAENIGAVEMEVYAPRTAEELEPLFEEALRVEDASWKGEAGSSLKRDATLRAFFRRYCELAAAEGELRIFFLKIGGQTVAMQLAVEYDRRLWLFKIGHDERYGSCSPGMLLMLESLRYAAKNLLRSYEFMGSSSQWTRRWTKHEHRMVKLRSYPYSLRGVLLLARDWTSRLLDRARNGVKR